MNTFSCGTKVFIDGKYPATVSDCFPEGSTSYAFPHYKLREKGAGPGYTYVAIDRVKISKKREPKPAIIYPSFVGEDDGAGRW